MTIQVRVRNQDTASFRLDRALLQVNSNLERQVETEAINLTAYVKQQKLSDQVLRVRTGRLRRSITYRLERDSDSSFRAYVGTNVVYARAQELGFDGDVQVKEYTRRNPKQLAEARYRNKKGETVLGAKHRGEGTVVVRAHVMHMRIKAKRFLSGSLEDNKPRIMTNLRNALAEALRGSK